MITDRVAIVTAAGRGIGAAVARRLAADGYRVVLLSPGETVIPLAEELNGYGLRGSVTSATDQNSVLELALAKFGRVDVLVNNAGHPPKAALLELTDDQWREGFEMVMLSAVRMTRLVTPVMVQQGKGAIINLSSYAAFEPEADFPMTTIRAALSAWTKLYADQYAKLGVRINAVLPGFVDSLPEKEVRRERIPMARYAKAAEIAAAVAFLASDDASYITGQSIRVDGGLTRSM